MKYLLTQTYRSFPSHSHCSLLACLVGVAFLIGNSAADARGFVAVGGGGRGFVAAGGGYRGAAYRGYGWGAGYGYGYGGVNVTNVTNVSTGPVSSLPAGYLSSLPSGAAPVVVFGKTYYFANGTYYSPQFYGGTTVYVVANP